MFFLIRGALKSNTFIRRVTHYLKLLLVWVIGFLFHYIGIPKLSRPNVWIGFRPLILRMLWVDHKSEFSLADYHRHHEIGVQNNILNVIYADTAEGPVTVSDTIDSRKIHTYFWYPRRNYELANVIFDPGMGLILIDGMVVIESSYRFPKPDLQYINLARRCKNPQKIEALICSGIGWAYNYHHWLTEGLVTVLRIRKQFGTEIPFITPSKLARFQVEALNLLGVNRIESDVPVLCEKFLLAGEHQCSEAALRPSDIKLLRQTFIPIAVSSKPLPADLDIYISRSKSKGERTLAKEGELEQMMLDRGFLVVHTQDIEFAAEVALFAQARTIVGITGAGLANHLWMPRGGQLIEIRLNDFCDPSYGYTCPLLDLKFSVADCRRESCRTPAKIVMQKVSECLNAQMQETY